MKIRQRGKLAMANKIGDTHCYNGRLSMPSNGMLANETIVLQLPKKSLIDDGDKLEVHKVQLQATH